MFGLFLNSLSKVSADSSVLSYKSKIFAIYGDLNFFKIKYIFEVMNRLFSLFRKNFIES